MAKKEKVDGVPSIMKPEIVVFTCIGTSPLIQNNPVEFIGKSEDAGLAVKKNYNDEDEARLRLYVDKQGNYCHPSDAFTRAMVRAVTGKKFGKMSAPAAMKGSVFITDTFSTLIDEHGKPIKEYEIDRRSVVINKKARVLRCRPSFENWRIKVALEVDTAMLHPDQVKESLALAGRIVGIGDFRPEKGGRFGRFIVM